MILRFIPYFTLTHFPEKKFTGQLNYFLLRGLQNHFTTIPQVYYIYFTLLILLCQFFPDYYLVSKEN